MTFLGHLALGAAVATAFIKVFPLSSDTLPLLIGYGLGLLLPDIDEPGSYIGKRLYFVSRMLKELGIEHRRITHNFFLALSFVAIGLILGEYGIFLLGVGIGALVHDLGDMFTKGGIRGFFAPVHKGTARILPKRICFYTGSAAEYVLITLLMFITAWGLHG